MQLVVEDNDAPVLGDPPRKHKLAGSTWDRVPLRISSNRIDDLAIGELAKAKGPEIDIDIEW